jgi:AraC-like DNA-binding protein
MTTLANRLIIPVMPTHAVRRTVVSAQLLVQLASEHGLAPEQALRDTGIDASVLIDPRAEITSVQELQLVRNLVARLGHVPALGLEAGLRYHLSAYGIWGFALLSSPNFRAVADVVSRFLDLSYAFVRFELGDENGAFWVDMDDSGIPADTRTFLLERDLAACCNVLRELRPGGLPIRELRLRRSAPAYARRFADIAGVMPIFDADRNGARFDLVDVDAPLPQANPLMSRMCLQQCQQLLARRQERSGLAGQVRERLLQTPGVLPDAATVARDLLMSERSLRRRLEAEDTSFRVLADEVRQTLAEELLTTADLKLEEVAQRLGYSEPASLIHAFKRWKGVTPSAYRAQRRHVTA